MRCPSYRPKMRNVCSALRVYCSRDWCYVNGWWTMAYIIIIKSKKRKSINIKSPIIVDALNDSTLCNLCIFNCISLQLRRWFKYERDFLCEYKSTLIDVFFIYIEWGLSAAHKQCSNSYNTWERGLSDVRFISLNVSLSPYFGRPRNFQKFRRYITGRPKHDLQTSRERNTGT